MSLSIKKPSNSGNFSSWQIMLYVILLASLIVAYLPVLKNLFSVWMDSDEYSHGFFIIPISMYMVWRQRESIGKIEPMTSWTGLFALFATLFIYLLSSLIRITTISSVTLPLCIAAIILFLYGTKMLRAVFFPVFFLLLMIPVPEQIYSAVTIQLQLLVSKLSVEIASTGGIPIYREGNIIHLPNRTLQVVQACSGIRSLITLLTLCLVIGYFGFKSNILRAVIAIGAIPIAVLVNIFRVLLMIVVFHYLQFDLTEDPIHTYLGLLVFALSLGMAWCLFKGLSLCEK